MLGEETPPLACNVATRFAVFAVPAFRKPKFTVTDSPESMAPFAGVKLSLVNATPEETISGASELMAVTTFVELFAGAESVAEETTANKFVAEPALMPVATIVAVALPFATKLPKSQVITPPENEQLPCEFVAETKKNAEASRLVSRTESA